MFLRVTPTTGVGRVLKSRKLTPRFIGSYNITRRIGPVAYEIALSQHLANLHNVFHVSQLRKYVNSMLRVHRMRSVKSMRRIRRIRKSHRIFSMQRWIPKMPTYSVEGPINFRVNGS